MEEDLTEAAMDVVKANESHIERYPHYLLEKFSFLWNIEEEEELILCNFNLMRPMRCNLGLLDIAHGSVKLYQGDTCVICAVYGPSDIRISKELPHRAAVDVLYRPKVTGTSQLSQNSTIDPTWEERSFESIITGIMESTIVLEDDLSAGFNIILHEYENDGCILAVCINAVSIALMKAGCSIRHPVAAVTVAYTKDGCLIIDPNLSQLKKGWQAIMIYAFNNQNHVLYCNMQGSAPKSILQFAMEQAKRAANEFFRFQMRLIHHDNCQEHGYKEGDEEVSTKDEQSIEEVQSTKLNFTNLKVDGADADNSGSDRDTDDDE